MTFPVNSPFLLFQSALPRGERPLTLLLKSVDIPISIRAPTRGATFLLQFLGGAEMISIRAPTRGATDNIMGIAFSFLISIRAPTRGATSIILTLNLYPKNFNPRSHEGSDINFHQKVLFSLSKNCLIHLFFITNFLN